jgi:hypothetical protein
MEPGAIGYVRAAVEREAMTQSINQAWGIMAALTLIGALLVLVSVVRTRKPVDRRLRINRAQPFQCRDS